MAEAPQGAGSNGGQPLDMSCMGTGMDVTCSVDEGPGLQGAREGAADAEASTSGLQQLAALLLLISPFFFWGTSMVAMKVWLTPSCRPPLPCLSHSDVFHENDSLDQ